jgi:hypothetical protein
MLLFKKIRNTNAVTGEAQVKNNREWRAFKKRIAYYLQQKSELLSAQAKKYGLISFCLLFGGSSLAVIIHSVTTKDQSISITKISKPAHSIHDEKSYLKLDSPITKHEYDRVEQFKNYLFDLKTDSFGRIKFDSIIQVRPGLIDSINLFEKMYLQQK